MIATGLGVLVVEKVGRKLLLTLSIVAQCISIFGLGAYFYLDENSGPGGIVTKGTMANLGWLPLVCMIAFFMAFSFGFGPLAWTMNVELHSREALAVMPSVGGAWCCVFAFLIGKFATNIEMAIHPSGLYFMNSGICALGTLFCIFIVPETKGKTPEDMKRYFQGS